MQTLIYFVGFGCGTLFGAILSALIMMALGKFQLPASKLVNKVKKSTGEKAVFLDDTEDYDNQSHW